jgi:hypothetical protein
MAIPLVRRGETDWNRVTGMGVRTVPGAFLTNMRFGD